jgi:hypothetical protein
MPSPAVSNWAAKTVQTPSFGIFLASAFWRKCRMRHLRHSFTINALQRWYDQGLDVQTKLPHLATYLGHVSPVSTYYYLRFTPELRRSASQRFYQRFAPLFTERGII